MCDYYQKIDSLIDGWQGEMIEMLRRWISVPSMADENCGKEGAPFGDEVRKALDIALKDADAFGFETDLVDGYAGSIQYGTGERCMGMLCHLDVVPAGDGWTYPPFELSVSEGRMFGRGIADDKGPAVAALFAMRAVKESGIPMKDAVRLILGCDEETGMRDMRYYAAHRKMPDYGFSPDADFPVINIEKGGMTLKLSTHACADPACDIPIYEMYAGEAVNVVPGKAYAIVGTEKISAEKLNDLLAHSDLPSKGSVSAIDIGGGRAKIEAIGQSAHASMPHLGINAAGLLFIALKELKAGGKLYPAITLIADKIGLSGDGSGLGIDISDEESGALTCNLGLLRYDGVELNCVLDCRVPICGDTAALTEKAKAAAEPTMSVECLHSRGPHHVPADSEIVQGLLAAYHEVTELPAYAFAIGGGTYSRMMPNTVAFGFNFPGDPDPCHMPDESVEINKFVLSTKIFAHAIARLAGCND